MHTLYTEAKAWLKWAKRRWWVVYLVLLVSSHLLGWIWARESESERVWTGAVLLGGPFGRFREKHTVDGWRDFGGESRVHSAQIAAEVLPAAADRDRVVRPFLQQSHVASGAPIVPDLAARSERPLVVLLHGSPGSASDFAGIAPFLASAGYSVVSIDLPGYGESAKDFTNYSIEHQARYVVALLDATGVRRAHVLGWSLGGGVALHVADQLSRAKDNRIASLNLMSSIGAQEAEGSGDYDFEHFKYAVGYGALVIATELVPHFGLFGPRLARHAFIRNFWDTDQRPLRAIMERLTVPTLILHGRHDALVPARAAELHHRLIPTSRLVVLDANHFLPFFQAEDSSKYLLEHFKRHDRPGVEPRRDVLDLAPHPEPRTWLDRLLRRTEPVLTQASWPAVVGAIALALFFFPTVTAVICGVLVAQQQLDWFVMIVGLCAGWVVRTIGLCVLARVFGERAYAVPILGRRLPRDSLVDWRRRLSRTPVRAAFGDQFVSRRRSCAPWAMGLTARPGAWGAIGPATSTVGGGPSLTLGVHSLVSFWGLRFLGIVLWSAWALLVFLLIARPVLNFLSEHLGGFGAALGLLAACCIVGGSLLLLTRSGRSHLRARLARMVRHEFWPAWLFYLPVLPYALYLGRKHRGFMLPSCCNPGIEAGGGLIGESKHAIMSSLGQGLAPSDRCTILPTILISPATSTQARVAHVEALISQSPGNLAYPVILKPDEGQRGFAVRLIRSREDLLPYFRSMHRPAVLQPYHPGPCEAGILWARVPGQSRGRIFSITRKTFPVITGDGKHTLEELIESHPRYRCQASVYLERFAERASEVLPAGDELRLVVSGNHCQGALFSDGADLITPALEAAIEDLAANFGGFSGHPGLLDFGRFDARYTSDDDLRAGRGFAVLELNGTMSESTNLYDPDRSILWAYGVLFRQWRTLYELGAHRRGTGIKPITIGRFLSMVRDHFKHRDGPALAD